MKGLYILGAIFLVLFLLAQIRIGAVVEYSHAGLHVQLRIGVLRIRLLPVRQGKEKKPQKEKKAKKTQEAQKEKPKGGLVDLVLAFLPLVLETAKKFRRKLQVDKLDMELTVSAPDPADAAMRYGQANALLGSVWQPITRAFHVKDGRAHVGVDFDAQSPAIHILASLSLTIGQALVLGVVFGVKALGILVRTRNKQKQEQDSRQTETQNAQRREAV